MIRSIVAFTVLWAGFSCSTDHKKSANSEKEPEHLSMKWYSDHVGDTFLVSIGLPESWKRADTTRYPLLVLVDGNFYFDMLDPVFKMYSRGGLMQEYIIVGIGYKEFEMMEELRDRDFTYPDALPEYEMRWSGGAPKFYSFIAHDLLPGITTTYRVDTNAVSLAGHSLGGYFVLYALHEQMRSGTGGFDHFLAASPSVNYNNYWLIGKLVGLKPPVKKNVTCHVIFGGEEEEDDEPGYRLSAQVIAELEKALGKKVNFKGEIFSGLSHMETPLPAFIKGIRYVENAERLQIVEEK